MRHFFMALATGAVALVGAGGAEARTLIRDAEIERTLRAMSVPIFRAAGISPRSVKIYMIRDNTLNAFVAGGQNIFLNTGLLMELTTVEELLGVLAHETGHLAGGHQARRAMQIRNARGPALLGLLIGIAAGVAGGGDAGVAVAAGSQGLLARTILRNSRADEASADLAALDYLERAKISPKGLLAVIERFRGQEVLSVGNVDPYVLTHPLSTERMSMIERRVKAAGGRSYPDDAERAYWHARMRAKLEGFLKAPDDVLSDLEGKPETELALLKKAVALFRLPDRARAVAAIDRLLKKRPRDAYYWELKGQILLETGRPAEALAPYRMAVKLAPREPLLWAGLGRALLQPDKPALNREALRVLIRARSRDLADAAALRNLALAYARAKKPGNAALATAEWYALRGQVKDAVIQARRAARVLPRGSPGWLRAQDILKLDKSDK